MTGSIPPPSDSTQFDATPEYMHDVASETGVAAGNIGSQLNGLIQYCRGFEGLWDGAAHEAFQGLMTRFRVNADQLNEALVNISKELHLNAANYEQGEHTNHLQIVNLTDSVPPVNL